MTQSNFLELAKQGDPQAIATLMNRSLQPKGLTAKATWIGERLQVLLEAEQVPNRQVLTSFVQTGLQKLNIPAMQTVEVVGKQVSADIPAWSEEITLATPPLVPPPAPSRGAIMPPPLPPRNPNIEATETASSSSMGSEVQPAAEPAPHGLSDELDLEGESDSPLQHPSSASDPADEPLPSTAPPVEQPGQFDPLAAATAAPEPSLGDSELDDMESISPASAGFVLPGLNGDELPTLSDSLTLEELHDLHQFPVPSTDPEDLTGAEDESDPIAYIPSTDLDDLEPNDDAPLEPPLSGGVTNTPQLPYYPPSVDPDLDLTAHSPEYEPPVIAEEDLVEERRGVPAAGWFAAGLLGVLVLGALSYVLISSSLGGSSLLRRVLGQSPTPLPPEASVTPLPTPTASAAATPTADAQSPLQQAIALEPKITQLEANAQSVDDWNLIVGQWQAAIALLQQVPADSPDGTRAQQTLAQYQQKLTAAKQRASQPAAANTPSSTTTTTIAGNVACQAVASQADSQPVELSNLKIQPGQGGNIISGCLTNHTDQAIAQISLSYEAVSTQDPNLAQGGLGQIASPPLQPRETVPFTGVFTLDPNVTNVKIESIFWTPTGTQEPQRIPIQLVVAPAN